jgi:hypothetical protein
MIRPTGPLGPLFYFNSFMPEAPMSRMAPVLILEPMLLFTRIARGAQLFCTKGQRPLGGLLEKSSFGGA